MSRSINWCVRVLRRSIRTFVVLREKVRAVRNVWAIDGISAYKYTNKNNSILSICVKAVNQDSANINNSSSWSRANDRRKVQRET
jgi:hypothetical protein